MAETVLALATHSRELLRAITLQNFAGGVSDQAPGVVRHDQRLVR